MRALLDVNVLIALLDASHVSHGEAMAWFSAHAHQGWASCALTQNGCVRIMSGVSYPGARPATVIGDRLRDATMDASHAFWPDDVSILDATIVDLARVHSPRHLTDVYLLALAVRHGGRLVTFDRTIPRSAVPAARVEHLVVL
ncbi:MAG TPA: TA system VapC family ribonuclease toxin [Gemmatimonas sp.]|uniref:TA system VapC family ribonuclease toxin n=1 Tax=Gemmatimonas sp. TaxID=1962908 RepID=UPI002ED97454